MPLIRGHHTFDNHFTQIPNEWVRDARLSFKARGLLTLLMSHTPGWNMSVRSIARYNHVGINQVKSAVEELEQFGYLTRSQKQSRNPESGTFADFEWTTTDPCQNPVTVKTADGKRDTKNTNTKEEQSLENNQRTNAQDELERLFEEFWQIYPRKVGKQAARREFVRALKKVDAETLIAGARRFATDPNLPYDKTFVAHARTWLSQGRWDDEPMPQRELTLEERQTRAKEKAERDRALALAENERQRAEAERARLEVEANPPQWCEHDRIKVMCPTCSPILGKKASSNE